MKMQDGHGAISMLHGVPVYLLAYADSKLYQLMAELPGVAFEWQETGN